MRRFYKHLEPGGALVMPFHLPWQEGEPEEHNSWRLSGEAVRPEDGLLARRWSRARYDVAEQLEHTEDRYELSRDGEVIASEHHRRSPATRWYTQEQAARLFEPAGFTSVRLLQEFSHEPASANDTLYTVIGTKP